MGIPFLVALLCGVTAYFLVYYFHEVKKARPSIKDKRLKFGLATVFALVGFFGGLVVSVSVGERIADECFVKNHIVIIQKDGLVPFQSQGGGVYIIIGRSQENKNVAAAWFLQGNDLFEVKGESVSVNEGRVIFSKDEPANKQRVRPDMGAFWRYFAFIPTRECFVVPPEGLQIGRVEKRYCFIPKQ